MGLDDLKHETGRDAGIERIAAPLEHRHAGGSAEPMSGGDDPEGAEDLRPCREHMIFRV